MKDSEVKYLKVGQVAELFGVSTQTVRNYQYTKMLVPDEVTSGGTRLYKEETVNNFLNSIIGDRYYED